jgi:hypothetical protein
VDNISDNRRPFEGWLIDTLDNPLEHIGAVWIDASGNEERWVSTFSISVEHFGVETVEVFLGSLILCETSD